MNAHIQQVTQNESHIKYSLVLNDLDKVNLDDSTFKYRNRSSSFNRNNRIILHKGLWKALNVNY